MGHYLIVNKTKVAENNPGAISYLKLRPAIIDPVISKRPEVAHQDIIVVQCPCDAPCFDGCFLAVTIYAGVMTLRTHPNSEIMEGWKRYGHSFGRTDEHISQRWYRAFEDKDNK